jgi:hypothetical protein
VMIRSESTNALGHPSETKLIRGAAASCIVQICLIVGRQLVLNAHKDKASSCNLACYA